VCGRSPGPTRRHHSKGGTALRGLLFNAVLVHQGRLLVHQGQNGASQVFLSIVPEPRRDRQTAHVCGLGDPLQKHETRGADSVDPIAGLEPIEILYVVLEQELPGPVGETQIVLRRLRRIVMLEVIVDPYLMDHITARFEDAVKIGQEILDVSDEDMLQAMEAEDQIEGAVRELSRAAVGSMT
jgi:succinate dehydrogenase flavin-adding protein (antitoxin of CptAB toxin-antitoxin module)